MYKSETQRFYIETLLPGTKKFPRPAHKNALQGAIPLPVQQNELRRKLEVKGYNLLWKKFVNYLEEVGFDRGLCNINGAMDMCFRHVTKIDQFSLSA